MFVQVIQGQTTDAEQLRHATDEWNTTLRPGATGFLGTTGGVSTDGRAILVARFESAEAARANSQRPEQSAWWSSRAEPCFTGEVTFRESTDVDLLMGGGSDQAGFAQVMHNAQADRALVEEMDAVFEEHAPLWRPDVIGGLRAWFGPTEYLEVMYFTSEADARANEATPPPAAIAQYAPKVEALMNGVSFSDIPEPLFG